MQTPKLAGQKEPSGDGEYEKKTSKGQKGQHLAQNLGLRLTNGIYGAHLAPFGTVRPSLSAGIGLGRPRLSPRIRMVFTKNPKMPNKN